MLSELVMVSEELLIICSAEELEKLEDVVPVSELDSIILEEDDSFPVAIEKLLAGISGSCCSGISALDDESEEHAVSTAATAAPEKITPSLVFVNCMF